MKPSSVLCDRTAMYEDVLEDIGTVVLEKETIAG